MIEVPGAHERGEQADREEVSALEALLVVPVERAALPDLSETPAVFFSRRIEDTRSFPTRDYEV